MKNKHSNSPSRSKEMEKTLNKPSSLNEKIQWYSLLRIARETFAEYKRMTKAQRDQMYDVG